MTILNYFRYWLDLTPDDIHWNLSDTGWAKSAWSTLFAPWIQGACIFVQDSPKFDPELTLEVKCMQDFKFKKSEFILYDLL